MKNKEYNPKAWSPPAIISTYPLVISFITLFLMLSVIVIQSLIEFHLELLPHELAVSVLAASLPFIASYIHKKMSLLPALLDHMVENEPSDVKNFHVSQEKRSYFHWAAYLLPIIFTIIALQSVMSLGTGWWNFIAAKTYNFLIGLLLLLTGSIGWLFLSFLIYIKNIENFDIIGEPFSWPQKYFRKLGQVSLDVFFVGVVVYLGAILTVWLIPWGKLVIFSSPFGYLWVLPLAITVISYFLVSQYLVHQVLKRSKEKRLDKIDQLLGDTYGKWNIKPGDDKTKMLGELIRWREIITNISDWPITIKTNFAVIGGLLTPVIGAIIQYIFR
jgi:hypothetical protein